MYLNDQLKVNKKKLMIIARELKENQQEQGDTF
jgi:hypothetical protein